MNFLKLLIHTLLTFSTALSFSSCLTSRPVPYFSGGQIDTTKLQQIYIPDQVVQKGDILNIKVFSDNAGATAIYNQTGGSPVSEVSGAGARGMGPAETSSGPSGYLVDNNGNIRMHTLGLIRAEGLNRQQLEELITSKLNNLGVLTNPYCIVRFSNFKITVLGEVKTPGVFTIPNDRATILEALGMAGDITDYGHKDQVLLIRESAGKRAYYYINLVDPQVFSNPNFYLRQNDVVVVRPDKKKPMSSDQRTLQIVSVGLAAVSTAAIIISLFR
jgi:polysaccharide export outer membrane protein